MQKPIDDALIDRFCDHLWLEDGLVELTLAAYRRDLKTFAGWLENERKQALDAAVAGDVEAYLAWRYARRAQPRSAARYTSALKRFYRYLLRENLIAADPTLNLDSPKLPRGAAQDADRGRRRAAARQRRRRDAARAARPRDAGDTVRHRPAGCRNWWG